MLLFMLLLRTENNNRATICAGDKRADTALEEIFRPCAPVDTYP
jgi:hypothetical protein